MRRIAINGRFLTQPLTGVQRYAREVIQAMDRMLAAGTLGPREMDVELLVPPGTRGDPGYRHFRVRECGWGSGQVWEQLALPWCCRGRMLFTPSGGSPLLHRGNVFMLPDISVLATPAAYRRAYRSWYGVHHRLAVRERGLRLLTVSQFSRREIARWLKVPAGQIAVTAPGHEHVFAQPPEPGILSRLGLLPGTFVLGVGSANSNKNFAGLIAGFERMLADDPGVGDVRLVIVGGVNPEVFGRGGAVPPHVVQAGYVSDGELRALYEAAGVFCFPSLYEGFGLPPLEAMALGCPVVCSDAASLPEVCGTAAELVDARDPAALARGLRRALRPEERARLIAAGLVQSRRFRWETTARQTWEILLRAAQKS